MRTLSLMLVILLGGIIFASADDSLVAHLRFNEGQGSSAGDSSGRGNPARLVNIQWEEFGLEGHAVRLNGIDSYIDFGESRDFNFTQNFTLSLWMKAEKFERGMSLWTRGNHTRGWETYIFRSFFVMSSAAFDDIPIYRRQFGAGTSVSYPFMQVAITGRGIDDDTTELTFYFNGEEGRSYTVKGSLPLHSSLKIGQYASAQADYFNGVIDEAKVYNRPLSGEEISSDYKRTLQAAAAAERDQTVLELAEVKLPPLERKRVAVFAPGPDFPDSKSVRGIDWFEAKLNKLGLRVTRLSADELGDTAILNTENFDTLILPVGGIPFEGEYSIYRFLEAEGVLITNTCTPTVWKIDSKTGEWESKMHGRGWYAPFLIRHLDFEWARRTVSDSLGLNPSAGELVGNLLPPSAGPYPNRRYRLVDRWDLHHHAPGRTGDTDIHGFGPNLFTASDVMLPLYRLPNGEAADFHVYRYFNNLLFGGTLIELGAVGDELLNSEDGSLVLRALLHFAEHRLPGEQPRDYYRAITRLHADWSELGDVYVDTLTKLRDAVYFAYLSGNKDWSDINHKLASTESMMLEITRAKNEWDEALYAGRSPDDIATGCRDLDVRFAGIKQAFLSMQEFAERSLRDVPANRKVPVKSPHGGLLVVAFQSFPMNLHKYRTWHFDVMKEMGVNVCASRMHKWYVKDPIVQRKMDGILKDLGFQYGVGTLLRPSSGELNVSDGTVRDDPWQEFDHERAEEQIKNALAPWQEEGLPLLRIGLAHEFGMRQRYWGSQARQHFQDYLSGFYANDISVLNRHWGTDHASFSSIQLPARRPSSPGEHTAWEHWRTLREKKFEGYMEFFYHAVKKYAPDLAVFGLVSTGSIHSPLYGVNFYNLTRYQDISAIDGTAINPPMEWIYLDLTKKPVLTAEWGGLYHPASLPYVNGKLWEELTGGSLGFNFWCWQFGSSRQNYVNFAGFPTLYGSRARATVGDAKKIEHIILDGRRVRPEVGILFSQTSRAHDQGWGGRGSRDISPHVQSVTNYYGQLLKFHRSARVVAEEQLLEEDIGYLRMLIVPQASFLSEEVQRRLLDYAEKGGKLVLEGRVGQFDNFGQPSNLLFRSARVVPSHASETTVRVGGSSSRVSADDAIFSPSALSDEYRILAYFGEQAAAITAPLGKGEITILGFSAGLHRYSIFQNTLEALWQDHNLTPRFIVSEDEVLLREWEYDGDTYLLLTSRDTGMEAFQLDVKIRGGHSVEDYLFGRNVGAKFEDGYTTFSTMMSNGGRTFRIPGLLGADAAASSEKPAKASAARPPGDEAGEVISLPFSGKIFGDTPLTWKSFVFRSSTIAGSAFDEDGETYMIISKGDESQKKRILPGNDYYFRIREATFKVRSSLNWYNFPFYSEVSIEKVDYAPPQPVCEINMDGRNIKIKNDLILLRIDTGLGGGITEIALKDDLINHVASQGELASCTENIGTVPGPFASHPFAFELVKSSEEKIVLELFNREPVAGKNLRKRLTLRRGESGFSYNLNLVNLDPSQEQPPIELRWHPELAVGGLADEPDLFVVPAADGILNIPYLPTQSGMYFHPEADWAAVVDRAEEVAYVTVFNPEQARAVYIWRDSAFYLLEIFSRLEPVKTNESIVLDLGIYLLRGLSGMDLYKDGYGIHAVLPESLDHRKPVNLKVEFSSAYWADERLEIRAEILSEGRPVADFGGRLEERIAFDLPVKRFLEADLSGLPDGVYTLQLVAEVDGGPELYVSREVRLSGAEYGELLGYYEEYRNFIEALQQRVAPGELQASIFDFRVRMEKFRSQIAAGKLAEARTLRKLLCESAEALKR